MTRSLGVAPSSTREHFSAGVRGSWAHSVLAGLSPEAADRLAEGAVEVHLPPGTLPAADHEPDLLLVVSGLVRTFRYGGIRQVTTRYAGDSDVIGLPSVIRYGTSARGELLTEAHLLRLRPGQLRGLVKRDAAAGWLVMREIVRLHDAEIAMTCDNVFLAVRQRVARHLLDLAVREGDSLVVYASHQEIADAIGSVREVVSRVLQEFGAEALTSRCRKRLVLDRPAVLHRVSAHGGPVADD